MAMLAIFLSASLLTPALQAEREEYEQITTFRCRFVGGPRTGQVQDYSEYSNLTQILVGWPCQDGAGSWGFGVPNTSDEVPQMPRMVDANGVPILPHGITLTCKFDTGPRAGEVQRFGPPVMPFRVSADCSDGAGNSGIAQE
jgi:hypothetical protein